MPLYLPNCLSNSEAPSLKCSTCSSGGALSRASIFALGIMPYISASIIVQLLTVVYQPLAELKKEGESGRRKISQYTRYGTLVLAIFQSIGIATGLPNMPGMQGLVINPGFAFYFTAVVSLVTGTMFLMWLGEQITERGIGNGISIPDLRRDRCGTPAGHRPYYRASASRRPALPPVAVGCSISICSDLLCCIR